MMTVNPPSITDGPGAPSRIRIEQATVLNTILEIMGLKNSITISFPNTTILKILKFFKLFGSFDHPAHPIST